MDVLKLRAASMGLLVGSACVDPLPPPTVCEDPAGYVEGDECRSCPPPADSIDGDCLSSIFTSEVDPRQPCFTSDPATLACFLGEDAGDDACTSSSQEDRPACYELQCPPGVTERAPGAQCQVAEARRNAEWVDVISPEWASELPPCVCRSGDELARCDGRGVVVAALNLGTLGAPDGFRADAFILPLLEPTPNRGRVGLYVRARGYSSFLALNVSFESGEGQTSFLTVSSKEFEDFILYGPASDGVTADANGALATEPLRWPGQEDVLGYAVVATVAEPGLESVFPEGVPPDLDNGVRRYYAVEIDCMVPFYVAD
jgi:hypothetical protein